MTSMNTIAISTACPISRRAGLTIGRPLPD